MENFAFFLHFVFVVVVIIVAICFVSDIRKWTTSESIEMARRIFYNKKLYWNKTNVYCRYYTPIANVISCDVEQSNTHEHRHMRWVTNSAHFLRAIHGHTKSPIPMECKKNDSAISKSIDKLQFHFCSASGTFAVHSEFKAESDSIPIYTFAIFLQCWRKKPKQKLKNP